jgi:hypothetical protein
VTRKSVGVPGKFSQKAQLVERTGNSSRNAEPVDLNDHRTEYWTKIKRTNMHQKHSTKAVSKKHVDQTLIC